MKLRFLLAILLFAVCGTAAMGRPCNKIDSLNIDSLNQVHASLGDFGTENEKGFGLFLLGAMAFPVILICSYELCRSLRVRQPVTVGSFHPLPAVKYSLVFRDVGIIHEGEREHSVLVPSKGVIWNAVCP